MKLNLSCEAKTIEDSNLLFESKLINYSAGTSIGPTIGPGMLDPFRLAGLDQPGCRGIGTWEEAGTAETKSSESENLRH